MWIVCALCGAVVADEALHTAWHTSHDQAPDPTDQTEEQSHAD